MKEVDLVMKAVRKLLYAAIAMATLIVLLILVQEGIIPFDDGEGQSVEKSVDSTGASGVTVDIAKGQALIKQHCTSCHSEELFLQNKLTRDGWLSAIRWMQKSEGLWDLGTDEAIILDYLAQNFTPEKGGRRRPIEKITWYELEE